MVKSSTWLLLIWVGAAFSSHTQAQTQRGVDIDGENADDRSGRSVSMPDPNTLAIGAFGNDGNGANSGHVRVFRWNGAAWTQKGLDIDGEANGDQSGISVSMPDSNMVAIGALGNDGSGTSSGHVRIYRWNGSAWVQRGADINGESQFNFSGTSVSMPDTNTVAIGANGNSGSGVNAGHVRVYEWNGNAWIQKGADIDGEAGGDESGSSVSMPDANTVAIGAPYNSGSANFSGHVRVYEWNGSTWVQKGVDLDGEAGGDESGISVSMPDADVVAIGAISNDGNGSSSGHVRVFEWNGSVWIQKGADIDGEAVGDLSGSSVSMFDENTIAIGAGGNDGGGGNSGHVRIYEWNGNAWVQKGVDIDGEAVGDDSGTSVSMPSANTVAVGAFRNDGNGGSAGHVRVFDIELCSTTTGTDIQEACQSFTWIDSNTYTSSNNTAMFTLTNAAGCDSIVTLNLTINDPSSGVDVQTACESFTWIDGMTYVESNNTATVVLTNAAGCDSTVSLDLTINTVDATVNQIGAELTASLSGAAYQWLDCDDNNAPISGATNQTYTATENGNYAVAVAENGCTDTSSCLVVSTLSVDERVSEDDIRIFPNPSKGQVTIESFVEGSNAMVIEIHDAAGRQMLHEQIVGQRHEITTHGFERGLYFLSIHTERGSLTQKLIME